MESGAIDFIAVAQKISWRWVPWKCLNHLLRRPLSGRVFGDVEVDDFTSIMSQHNEYIQYPKRCRRNGEKVDRYQVIDMIVQKCPPRLRGWFSMTNHVLCNSRLGDDDAEHLQFAVNSRCTPANVVSRHRSDKFSYPWIDGWASSPVARGLPGPIQLKALAVPAHQGIRFEKIGRASCRERV